MNNFKYFKELDLITIKPWLLLLIFLAIGNIIYLDIHLLSEKREQKQIVMAEQKTNLPPSVQNACPASCMTEIYQATLAAKTQITLSPSNTTMPASVKEFYVPFRSGTDSQAYWDPVDSMQAYVNPASYGKIKQVVFEVSLSLPQANEAVSVRLFNMTANHPVWSSDVTMNAGNTSAFLVSQPINLDQGNNLYQVQMQTQLNTPATITQARLHIYTY